jgi:excisionase family DNA binding protein
VSLIVPAIDEDTAPRGCTPAELARLLRVSPDRIRAWIKAGELGAIDTARHRCGRPRYVILPHHLKEFEQRRSTAPPPKPSRRRRRPSVIDYYPD